MDENEEASDDDTSLSQLSSHNDDGYHVVKQRKIPGADSLADEFSCSVCLLVAVQPTTLLCGHTSCRICLARWYFTSHKKECPYCRQPYQGHPKINTHIRNVIAKLYPEELEEREKELLNQDEANLLIKYDQELLKEKISSKKNNGGAFCLGVIAAICVFVIAYLAWYWQFSETNLLVMKPVQMWKPRDVATWLEDFSWASSYANMSISNNIDGNMLLAMDEESLHRLLNISDLMHQKALMFAVEMLKEHRVKLPTTLWEYKALYPGRCLFLAQGLREFPRATYLYLYLYFYDDMFLPFVKSATKREEELDVSSSFTVTGMFGVSQWIYFLLSAAMVPQWLVIVLAYQMFSHHFFTPLFIIVTAALVEIIEILDVVSFFRNTNRDNRVVFQFLKYYARQLLHTFIFMLAMPVIPRFVCDIFFYVALYVRPFYVFMEMCGKLRQHINLE